MLRLIAIAAIVLLPFLSFAQQPNILLIIADDLGVDVSNGYHTNNLMPNTPTLDSLRSTGITFENVFAAPKCTPSRAAIMSGKYGIKTNVAGTPGHLGTEHTSIFKQIAALTGDAYANAVIGKWHISSPADPQHPIDHGADYFMGVLGSGVDDYFAWDKTEDGVTTLENSYVTTYFTDTAIDWKAAQTEPWFLWFAHVAPHGPVHLPPDHMYSIGGTASEFRKYVAMIESIDYEINRLLNSMTLTEKENTIIIYLGDNGTPNGQLRDYPIGHGKSTIYQGGVRVPMIISGAGVARSGEREAALVHVTDVHATLMEFVGGELPGGIHNSLSFDHLLKNESGTTRDYNYSEITKENRIGWTIRNDRYKFIQFTDGTQEFYDLVEDSLEFDNLMSGTLTNEQLSIVSDLESEAIQQRDNWSCRDHIQNGDEEGIDCGGSFCAPCNSANTNTELENTTLVFPNPSSDLIHIELRKGIIKDITLSNKVGQTLSTKTNIHKSKTQIDVSQFSSQVLFVKIILTDGNEVYKKVFKR